MSTLRLMTPADVPPVNDIYNQYIEHSHISFDLVPWTVDRRLEWFAARSRDQRYPLLVAIDGRRVVGGAWAGPYRPKPAYDRSVETTVIVAPDAQAKGHGKRLLTELIKSLRLTDAHRAYAVVSLPNEPSITLHHQLGYRTVGVLTDSGYKFETYWSTELLELDLTAD